MAWEHLVAEHFGDLFGVAWYLRAHARFVANRVQPAAALGIEEDAAAWPERRAVEVFILVRIGAGEIGGGGDPVVDHALSLVGEHVDARAAALLLAWKGRAIWLTQKWKRSHPQRSLTRLRPFARRKPSGISLASRQRWR
jgi:hypothetical protein